MSGVGKDLIRSPDLNEVTEVKIGGTLRHPEALASSFSHSFDDNWMPFFRAGYVKDGGSFLQKNNSLLGLGINWGPPNVTTYSSGLDDQHVFELFCHLQVTQNMQITPDIQYIINPALNKEEDDSWVLGLRTRVVF